MTRPQLRRPSPAMVVALIGLGVSLSGTAYAATGGNFLLGKANTATHVSALTNTAGAAMKLTSGGSGVPLALSAPAGVAPLTVNSATRVANLNADLLDGIDASTLTSAQVGSTQEFTGPLPHTLTGTFPMTGNLSLITVSGSGYKSSGTGFLELQALACPGAVASCAGTTSGAVFLGQAYTFTNETNSHKTISFVSPFQLAAGTWTLSLIPLSSTTTDSSDIYFVSVVSLG